MTRFITLSVMLLLGNVCTGFGKMARDHAKVKSHVGSRSVGKAAKNIDRTRDVSRNVNRARDINRSANINRNLNVSRDIDIDRDIDLDIDRHGGWLVEDDDIDWGWGAFAAGAAGAAVGAAVANASEPDVVVVPTAGTVVASIPSSCSVVPAGSTSLYACGNVYYQPVYQGSTLVYQVVNYR
jgi:hypothetical protein